MTLLNLPINPFFINFFNKFLYIFSIYIKKSKKLSVKYYQEKKERLQKKKTKKDIKIFLNWKKKKTDNTVVNGTKISQRMKKKSLFSIDNSIIE